MIYIVIPTYNERENLAELVKTIFALQIENLKVLIVDDNSPDGTGQIADALSAKYPVEVLHRQNKQGLGMAYKAGFAYALNNGANFVFEMDADFSHQPQDIPKLLEKAKQGFDLVIGSRKIKGGQIIGWNRWRHFCSDGAMLFARVVLGLKTKDLTAGFRCFKAEALQKINYETISSNGYAFQEELLYRIEKMGLKVGEVPVIFPDRQQGSSKLGYKDILDFFKTIIRLRFGR